MLSMNEKHEYFNNQTKVPGVNEILTALNIEKFSTFIPESALEKGSNIHLATALDDIDDLVEETLSTEILAKLNGWRKFKKDFNLSFMRDWIEQKLYSKTYNFAGTLDRLPIITKNKIILIDIKSGIGYNRCYELTTAAYSLLIAENFNKKVTDRWLVCLTDNDYKIKPIKTILQKDILHFIYATKLFNEYLYK